MNMLGGRHTCWATLGLIAGAIGCTPMLEAPSATFGAPDACPEEASASVGTADLDAGAGALAALDCLDQPLSSSPDPGNIDVTVIAFDRFQLYHFVPDDGVHGVRLDKYTPQPGALIQGCSRLDTACATPATPEAVTDATGTAHLVLSSTFDGFLRVRRACSMPGIYYPGPLPSGRQPATLFVSAMTPQDVQVVEGVFQLPLSSDATGSLAVAAYDCRGQPIVGATIELDVDAGFASYYMDPTADRTGYSGARVFFDVPAGNVAISAKLKETGRLLGTSNIYMAPGDYTVADIRLR